MKFIWMDWKKYSWISIMDKEISLCPISFTIDVITQKVNAMIQTSWKGINDKVAYHLHTSHCSTYKITHNRLVFKKSERWIPTQLTEEHKCNYVAINQCLWDPCANDGEAILKLIVTGNETWTWIDHFEPESKCKSTEWKHQIPNQK